MCLCLIHENISLLLGVLSKEVQDLKNDFTDFLFKLTCDEFQESCMTSCCDVCKNSFKKHIVKKIVDEQKIINWFQWTNTHEHAVKQVFSDKSHYELHFDF